jgi:hypothetical protein
MSSLDRLIDGCRVVAEQADEDNDAFQSAILCEHLVRGTNLMNDLEAVKKEFTAYRRSLKAHFTAQDEDAEIEAMQSLTA